MTKPLAGLSIDLDNEWSYMKTHGDTGWQDYPSYLGALIPRVLEFCAERDLKITFFIVGQDAALVKNRGPLGEITRQGHDVGNHSHRHEPWLHLYPRDKIREEVELAERAIEDATGRKPTGFRGPGFSWSKDLIVVLEQLGYAFDASTLPTWIGPLGRLYYFWKSDLTPEEKRDRKRLFGGLGEALLPVKPYFWVLPKGGRLLEVPVTTMPLLRVPIHFSYLLYLARYSEAVMSAYIRTAVNACRWTRTGLSFLLHPLDFLSGEDVPRLAFFPGMDIMKKTKLELLSRVIDILSEQFRLVPMAEYASALGERKGSAAERILLDKGA